LKCGFREVVGDNNFHDGTRLSDCVFAFE
jgi:hypothetical protein